jgi:hypothetical protein
MRGQTRRQGDERVDGAAVAVEAGRGAVVRGGGDDLLPVLAARARALLCGVDAPKHRLAPVARPHRRRAAPGGAGRGSGDVIRHGANFAPTPATI